MALLHHIAGLVQRAQAHGKVEADVPPLLLAQNTFALYFTVLLGWLNGFAIVRSGVNSFVITLASANLFSGAMLILTRAVPLNALPPEVGAFGRLKLAGSVSPLLVIALVIGAALFVLYRYSTLGRRILAAGANPRAAAMSGVPVNRVIVISHTLSGLLAAVAGMMVVARLGAAMPAVGGEEWLLPSFLGPVLGGTLLSGGAVSVIGTVLGAKAVKVAAAGGGLAALGKLFPVLTAAVAGAFYKLIAWLRRLGRKPVSGE